jgi:hypothetical protein
MRHPSPAAVIATAALFVAMSGTAYAATGGTFLLGKANTATSLTSLTNSKGTALSLSSKAGTPPLTVNSAVQVPNLNASTVDGYSAYSFVHGSGTAYVTWGGPVSINAMTSSPQKKLFLFAPPSDLIELEGDCDTESNPGAELTLYNYSGQTMQGTYSDSYSSNGFIVPNGGSALVSSYVLNPDISTIQVTAGSQILTFIAQIQTTTNGPDVCTFSAQLTTNQ